MMFVKLYQEGIVKAVVSQNCDGLHRRSGLPTTGEPLYTGRSHCDVINDYIVMFVGLFELHGNSNVEKCARCKHEYLRDYRIVGLRNHETGKLSNEMCGGGGWLYTREVVLILFWYFCTPGNVCDDPKCGGKLRDTIINFGENLPEGQIA